MELCKTMTPVDADREYSGPESFDDSLTLPSLLGLP